MRFSVNKDHLKSMMNSNLAGHTSKDNSWNLCWASVCRGVQDLAVDKYLESVPEAKRPEFRKFLEGLLSDIDSCKDAMKKLVEQSLGTSFANARQEICDEQFRRFFGPLANGSWKPSNEEIDRHYNKPSIEISEPLKMPGVSSESFDPANLLEETRNRVLEAERGIIAEGVNGLKGQMDLVEKTEPEIKAELQKAAESPTVEDLTKTFSGKVKSQWSGMKLAEKYADLFQRVSDDIRRRAKDMLPLEIARRERIKQQEDQRKRTQDRIAAVIAGERAAAEARKAEEAKKAAEVGRKAGVGVPGSGKGMAGQPGESGGGGGSGEGMGGGAGAGIGPGTGPGGGGGVEGGEGQRPIDVLLDIDYEMGKITASIIFPKKGPVSFEFVLGMAGNINPHFLTESMLKAQALFEAWLRNSVASGEENKDINLYVVARIFDGRVYYSIVFNFRECLKNALKSVGDQRLKVHWYDGLFDKKEKSKREIPPEIRIGAQPMRV